MDDLRNRLEQALVRRAARLLDTMADDRGDELAAILRELDERLAAVETGSKAPSPLGGHEEPARLPGQLAERDAELARLRSVVAALRRDLDAARAEALEAARRLDAESVVARDNEQRARELQQRLADATLRRSAAGAGPVDELDLAELAEREGTVERAQALLDLREDDLERLERALTDREHRLARRETELAEYVGQVQERLLA